MDRKSLPGSAGSSSKPARRKPARPLQMRLSEPDRAAFESAATRTGATLSAWIRQAARERIVRDAGAARAVLSPDERQEIRDLRFEVRATGHLANRLVYLLQLAAAEGRAADLAADDLAELAKLMALQSAQLGSLLGTIDGRLRSDPMRTGRGRGA